jgi:hypothetical protein
MIALAIHNHQILLSCPKGKGSLLWLPPELKEPMRAPNPTLTLKRILSLRLIILLLLLNLQVVATSIMLVLVKVNVNILLG